MLSEVKLKLWRFYLRIKKRNVEKFLIEQINCHGVEEQHQQLIQIVGWYHYSKSKTPPNLSIIVDEEVIKCLPVNITRSDVKRTYGSTSYPNGFNTSFLVKTSANQVTVVSGLTGSELYTEKISRIPLDLRTESIKEVEDSWIKKVPLEIRLELAETTKNDGYLVSIYTGDQMVYDLIRHLNRPSKPLKGYNIFSYLTGAFGVAQAGRAFVDHHLEKNSPIVIFDFLGSWHNSMPKEDEKKYTPKYFQPFIYETNVFLVNIHAALRIKEAVPELFKSRRNITSYWWEFETGFEKDIPALNQFDEILVFSDFILNILTTIKRREFSITKIQYPFVKNWTIDHDPDSIRLQYNLGNKFCFFFNFDFSSSYGRKNPLASLKAFHQGLRDNNNVMLVFKTNSSDRFINRYEEFLASIHHYGLQNKVLIIKDALTRNEFMSLLNATNCYISLHRGEGLGLGILEALALNVPVIATNYGGNAEYMDHELAHPVNYNLVPRDDDFKVYADVKEWAEPDIDQASQLMTAVLKKYPV